MFHEVRFPEDISYGATGGPEFATDVVKVMGGGEQRNQNWRYPLHKYEVSHGVKNNNQIENLIAFFYNRHGKAAGFRYKDWSDYEVYFQEPKIIDNTKRRYQLIKLYVDDGGFTEERIILKPVKNTVKVYFNQDLKAEGNDYNINYSTGELILTNPLGVFERIKTSFEFDVPCRFDIDYMPISLADWETYSWENIPIVELREG